MNRSIEQRGKDPRPQLSDLRESGAIEQDADMVIFIHREHQGKDAPEDKKNLAEIIIGKNRAGPRDNFELAFLSDKSLFTDYEPAANPQHKFCLTAAMQGCWFVITDSVPASPATFRLHHHQHPGDKALWQKMSPPTHIASHPNPPVTSTLARNTMKYSVYGAAEEGAATSANAFNVLVHENGVWNFLSQAHLLMPTAKGFNVARDSAFPIYTAQAYP